MNLLAIDTSGPNCSVALIDEQKVIAHFTINIGKTHSETLLPLVDELSRYTNISLKEVDAYACCIGPGSFTGIRIGIATIKGFALSIEKPVIAVSTLEGLAYQVPYFDGLIGSILNANHNNVYAAIYQAGETPQMIGTYHTDSIEDFIQAVKEQNQKIILVGDGAVFYHDILQKELSPKAFFVPQHINELSAISIARAALEKYHKGETITADTLQPLYLRKSQAERMMEQ